MELCAAKAGRRCAWDLVSRVVVLQGAATVAARQGVVPAAEAAQAVRVAGTMY